MNWGNVFEPASIKVYEDKFTTKIEDFGCIRHPKIHFIVASPDGVNVDPDLNNYGRISWHKW